MKRYNRWSGDTLLLLFATLLILSGCFQQEKDTGKPSDMYWIEDKSGTMTFDEIQHRDLSSHWNKAKQQHLNFGLTKSVIWLSLPFENTKNIQTPMLLEIAFPLHDSIDIYLLDNKEVIHTYNTGDKYPFAERPLKHRHFLFPYTVPPGKKLRIIARLQSTDAMYLPVNVWENNEFFAMDQNQVLLLGVFFGFLSIMLVYNLFLYFSTRHKNYIYYVWYTASLIYLQLTQKGLGYQYIWPDKPLFNHMSVPISSFIAIATSMFFILKFLNLNKEQHAKTILTFQTFIWMAFLGLIWTAIIFVTQPTATPYLILLLITAVIGIGTTIIVMGMLINLALRGNRSSQILSVAWVSLLAGSFLFALGRIGIPMPMLLTENAMLIGATFEAALISFALARHIKKEREARMYAQELVLTNERKTREAQHSLLALQEKTTQQLEQEVKERTQKLETAMQKLTLANHKLENLSRKDSLTGLSNRRNFNHELEQVWRNCTKQRKPISLLMADIDHFKHINDTYGHLFGDQCLMHVTTILKKCAKRPEDIVARFGGEEFIILLPDTDTGTAGLIAECIRSGIENLCLNYKNQQIQFTISIGITSIIPTPGSNCIDLIASSDQALYLAKEAGRNRVVTLGTAGAKTGKQCQKQHTAPTKKLQTGYRCPATSKETANS